MAVSKLKLPAMLEGELGIRNRVRSTGALTMWPSPETTGSPSVKAMKLNVLPLEVVARWWTSKSKKVTVIPIGDIRAEAMVPVWIEKVWLVYVVRHCLTSW
eukprot:Skav211750  [mRNA]  locus=scaffold1548:507563:507865:+ [translate_table: standard]